MLHARPSASWLRGFGCSELLRLGARPLAATLPAGQSLWKDPLADMLPSKPATAADWARPFNTCQTAATAGVGAPGQLARREPNGQRQKGLTGGNTGSGGHKGRWRSLVCFKGGRYPAGPCKS
jgi:hypothetical protein